MHQKDCVTHKNMADASANRPQTILKNSWTSSRQSSQETSTQDGDERLSGDSSPETERRGKNRQGPQKRVSFHLSDMRRQSLTGSLPDLTTATDKDVRSSSNNMKRELNIQREPLPEGSDIFRAAMEEIDTESDSNSSKENISDTLSVSWGGSTGSRKSTTPKPKFLSKTAAMMYAKKFPKHMDMTASISNPNSPRHQRKIINVNSINTGVSQNSWEDGRSSTTPSSPSTAIKRLSRSQSSPKLMAKNNIKVSPLVSGGLGDVRYSSEKSGIRRQLSTPCESPRLLQRSRQGQNRLTKSASLESD